MKLGTKLKSIRVELGLPQARMSDLGFISTPAWIKLENGQRSPSEKLIDKLVNYLIHANHTKATKAKALAEELKTLKYLEDSSAFVRQLATAHARTLPNGEALLAAEPKAKKEKGRPAKK